MTVPGEQGPYAAPQSPDGWSPTPPAPSGWLAGPWYEPELVHPSSRGALVVRVLIAVGLVIGLANMANRPLERTTNDLLVALQNGDVQSITIERPGGLSQDVTAGTVTLRVDWFGAGRPAYASYVWSFGDDGATDEGTIILDAAEEAGVEVAERATDPFAYSSGVTWHPTAALALLAGFAVLILLIAGPQPRLATKWAWFWLSCAITPLWLVFVVLEPLPLWANQPQPLARNRLTGGWAFLLGILLAAVAAWAWPDWADVLTN